MSKRSPNKTKKTKRKPTIWKRFLSRMTWQRWTLAGFFAVILGPITLYKECFKPAKATRDETIFSSGKLKPPIIAEDRDTVVRSKDTSHFNLPTLSNMNKFPLIKGLYIKNLKNYPLVEFRFGNQFFFTNEQIHKGFSITIGICYPKIGNVESYLGVGAYRDSLYVDARFFDIDEPKEAIGWINYNHWNIINDSKVQFNSSEKQLEVYDKKHNILFSLTYKMGAQWPIVYISGYFPGANVIEFDCNTEGKSFKKCVTRSQVDWRRRCDSLTKLIKPNFEGL